MPEMVLTHQALMKKTKFEPPRGGQISKLETNFNDQKINDQNSIKKPQCDSVLNFEHFVFRYCFGLPWRD